MFAQSEVPTGSGKKPVRKSEIALALSILVVLPFTAIVVLHAQTAVDPGPRGGPPGAGQFIAGLTSSQASLESTLLAAFTQVNGVLVSGNSGGLGPRFDSNSCASCHAQPAAGGASPLQNSLFSVFQLNGAQNTVPLFETSNGPVLVARFPFQSNLVNPDGHVHQLFVITGRSDAAGCNILQPDFATAAATNNLVFRQPTPLFGLGLIEMVKNSQILLNMNQNGPLKQSLGISGHPNLAGDNTVSRFGWKAQYKSLLIAAAEQESVEEGITNEFFPSEPDQTPGCVLNPLPEDSTNYTQGIAPSSFPGNPDRLALFMRFLDQPTAATQTPSDSNGQTQFTNIGCVLCHTTSFTTSGAQIKALSHVKANLLSDLLVHHMGPCLADNIVQGTAQGDEFRTAPLWGAGQRIFFLHDGRTTDIVQAVEDHFCLGNSQSPASEANAVITSFNALSAQNQQDLINFLRSL